MEAIRRTRTAQVFYRMDFVPITSSHEQELLHYQCPLCPGSYIDELHLARHLDWHVDQGDLEPCDPPGISPGISGEWGMEMFVVVLGGLFEGVVDIYGPFLSPEEAEEWADKQKWAKSLDYKVFPVKEVLVKP